MPRPGPRAWKVAAIKPVQPSGTSFWTLLQELEELSIYVQAFSDNVVLMFSGQSALSIEEEANRARTRNKLMFAPLKNNSMVLTRKLKNDDPVVVRTIYITAIEPIVLYASCTRASATWKARRTKYAAKTCGAHHAVALHSTLIFLRLLPLDIRVREAAWLYKVKRGKDKEDTFVNRDLERTVYFGDLPRSARVLEIGYERS
ncbi:hypothetical protein EVAR_35693_1 [Eumeta japonica]|uniref:Uncharacterized protein n=1 Tax=Eumeta variegata TaxID=151549 RepID=A0A4C1VFA8_EUMVA|nr:hypothetical protein EVAR_35693_1 [Eumeta japonica]